MGMGSIGNSGLMTSMENMESISNNIANVNTLGFKKSQVNFSDLYSNSMSSTNQVGFGVQVRSISQDFSGGRVELTGKPLDLSLSNDGFFVQRNAAGQVCYTRAGQMELDQNNYLTGFSGRLQGYPAINGVIVPSGNLTDMQIPNTPMAAKSTSNANLNLNLDASALAPTNPFNENDPATYNYRSDTAVYDSLGNAHVMSVYYIKSSDNNWSTQIQVDNQSIGAGALAFNSDGTFASETGMTNLSWSPAGGATSPQPLSLTMANSTQFGSSYSDKSTQDGYQSGIPTNYNIDSDGKLNVYYSNGKSQVAGQVAVARFSAPQGLARTDNMAWLATGDSGNPIFDAAASAGAIDVGKLEYSNVDLTEELVKLMGAQHDFQANAQVVQTYNQMLQTVENI